MKKVVAARITSTVTVQEAGRRGGLARSSNMPPALRKDLARRAALSRWTSAEERLRSTLSFFGGPVWGAGSAHMTLEEAAVEAVRKSSRSGHYFCVLAALVANSGSRMNWNRLWSMAADRGVERRLAMLVDWVGRLLGSDRLRKQVKKFCDAHRPLATRPAYYTRQSSPYGKEAARLMTPPEVRRWGYWVRMTDDGLKAFLEKHRSGEALDAVS